MVSGTGNPWATQGNKTCSPTQALRCIFRKFSALGSTSNGRIVPLGSENHKRKLFQLDDSIFFFLEHIIKLIFNYIILYFSLPQKHALFSLLQLLSLFWRLKKKTFRWNIFLNLSSAKEIKHLRFFVVSHLIQNEKILITFCI